MPSIHVCLSALGVLLIVSTPALANGAPPQCETDAECQEMGYEFCGVLHCEGGEAMDNHTDYEAPPDLDVCSSDADCPEGERCSMNPNAPRGACVPGASSAEDADAASQSAEEGASADESASGDAGDGAPEEEVSSGCQGAETPTGVALFAFGLFALWLRRGSLALER